MDTHLRQAQLLWTCHHRVGGKKVCTALLLQGLGLAKTVGPCAQRRVSSGHGDTFSVYILYIRWPMCSLIHVHVHVHSTMIQCFNTAYMAIMWRTWLNLDMDLHVINTTDAWKYQAYYRPHISHMFNALIIKTGVLKFANWLPLTFRWYSHRRPFFLVLQVDLNMHGYSQRQAANSIITLDS